MAKKLEKFRERLEYGKEIMEHLPQYVRGKVAEDVAEHAYEIASGGAKGATTIFGNGIAFMTVRDFFDEVFAGNQHFGTKNLAETAFTVGSLAATLVAMGWDYYLYRKVKNWVKGE